MICAAAGRWCGRGIRGATVAVQGRLKEGKRVRCKERRLVGRFETLVRHMG